MESKNRFRITNRLVSLSGIVCILLSLHWLASSALGLAPTEMAVYEDALAPGWEDWSWDTAVNFINLDPVHEGTASLSVAYTDAWGGGLYLHANALDLSDYDTVRFWLHGGSQGGQEIAVSLNYNGSTYAISAPAATWQLVQIPLSVLGDPATVSDLVFQDNSGGAQPAFYLDEIAFINRTTPTPTTPPPGIGPALSVDVSAGRHPISDHIYGMNFADEVLAEELGLPVRRWGGNSTTRYNWRTDVHNTGSDWYYENIPDGSAYSPSLPDGSTTDLTIEQDRRTGTKTILTIPLIGWSPKPGAAAHPYDCGFKVSLYGSQDSFDSWDTDCGNGLQGGSEVTGNDPTDTSIPIDDGFVTDWVDHLTTKYGTAAQGGVLFYDLDNEPMLWSETHRDVHPAPTGYDELRDLTYLYAAAVKAADPSALTLGPVSWGWCAYFYSALDGCSPGADYQSHGEANFTPWYLAQMAAYQAANGLRLLDYLDLHIYPQVSGVFSDELGDASVQAARLRSTRQLWDPTYVQEGWIGQPVYLIPRMQGWIADNYPGTKTAITEYNWGAHGYINGALAQADILGVFGREGLDLATLWDPPSAGQPAAFAFRMYLNYDGAGGRFGETAVSAASDDQDKLAVYAASRAADDALTVIVINKTAQPLTSTLTLTNYSPLPTVQIYRYSSENPNVIVRDADQPLPPGGFTASYPANSITLVVLLPEGETGQTIYLPIVLNTTTGPTLENCPVFPADHIWNTPVDTLPLDPNSAAYINTIGAGIGLHSDFGSGTWLGFPIGIPFVTVPGTQAKVDVTFVYDDESDPGPYPIPSDPPIEGDPDGDGDRHILILERDNCLLYELYAAHLEADGWHAGSGAIFDLRGYTLRPAGWTSADAAGLAILPGLVRYDEVASGQIRHAIRFTVSQTRQDYIWHARHYASSLTGSQYPPMGQRFRLRAGFDISGFSPEVQVILQAMKTYGLILADNGSNWYISGAPDERWDNDVLHELSQIHGSDFEAVDVSGLMINSDSGQVGP